MENEGRISSFLLKILNNNNNNNKNNNNDDDDERNKINVRNFQVDNQLIANVHIGLYLDHRSEQVLSLCR